MTAPVIAMTATQKWQLMGLLAVIALLVYVLAPVLTPFAAAALLGYLGDPLCDQLERRGFSRTVAVVLVFVAMTLSMVAVVLLLLPLLERQIALLVEILPGLLAWAERSAAPWIEQTFGIEPELLRVEFLVETLRSNWQKAGGLLQAVLGTVRDGGFAMLGWLANLALVPVLVFYFLRDWDHFLGRVHELLPRSIEPVVVQLARESDAVLGAFLRGQLLVMLALGVVYSIGLSLVGLKLAPLIGMVAGLISFIPYLGGIVGFAAAMLTALFQFGDMAHLLGVAAVFAVGQSLESFVLTPLLVGDRIGLHPVAVIFAIMAGGQLFGFLGVLLALPVAAVVAVVLRFLHRRYLESAFYGQAGVSAAVPVDGADPSGAGGTPAVPAAVGAVDPDAPTERMP